METVTFGRSAPRLLALKDAGIKEEDIQIMKRTVYAAVLMASIVTGATWVTEWLSGHSFGYHRTSVFLASFCIAGLIYCLTRVLARA